MASAQQQAHLPRPTIWHLAMSPSARKQKPRVLTLLSRLWSAYIRARRAAEKSTFNRVFGRVVCLLGGAIVAGVFGAKIGETIWGAAGRDTMGWVCMILGGPCAYAIYCMLERLISVDDEE